MFPWIFGWCHTWNKEDQTQDMRSYDLMGNMTQLIASHFLGLILFVPSQTSSKNPVKKKLYLITWLLKFTKFGTDTLLQYFAFFFHLDLGKINCAFADVKQVIFLSPGRNMYFWSVRIQLFLGYHVTDAKMDNLIAADKRT